LVGRTGELLAVVFRIRNARLPDATEPIAVLAAASFPLRLTQTAAAQFAAGIRLLGYRIEAKTIRPDHPLKITLFWQADSDQDRPDYTVFVHLLDGSGRMAGQADARPVDGRYPTNEWKAGDTIIERYTIPVEAPLAGGGYSLEIGMYQLQSGARLALEMPANDTSVTLGPFRADPANDGVIR